MNIPARALPAQSPPGAGRSTLLLCTLIVMADGFDLQNIGFVAPELGRAWSLAPSAFGPVFAAGLAGAIPGAMGAGPLARILGLRTTLAAALALFGLGTLMVAFVHDLSTMIALRFAIGVGLGGAIPVVLAVVAAAAPAHRRSSYVVVALCGQPIGAALGAQICARLIPEFGWQSVFLLGAAAPLLVLPGLLLLPARPGEDPDARESAPPARVRDLFGHGLLETTLLLWAAIFLIVLATYVIVHWLPIIMDAQNRSLAQAMNAMSLLNGGAIIGAVALGALMDRFGAFRILPATLLVSALALVALSLSRDGMTLFYAATLVTGLSAGGAGAAMGALTAAAYRPAMRATGAGWVFAVGRLGGALGPLGVGAVLAMGVSAERLFDAAALAAFASAWLLWTLARIRAPTRG